MWYDLSFRKLISIPWVFLYPWLPFSICFVLFCFVLFCFVFLPHSCCPWHENYCVSLEMEAQRWSEVPNVAQLLSGSFRSLDWKSRLLDFRTEAFGSIQQGQETNWTSEAQEMMFLRLLILVPSPLFCHACDTWDRPSLTAHGLTLLLVTF